MKVRNACLRVNGAALTQANTAYPCRHAKITPGRTGQKLGQLVDFGPDHASMMIEAALETIPNRPAANVSFVSAKMREELLLASEAEGWLPVRVSMPGPRGRGRLGVVLEESIEKSLELRGACPPGIAACADSDASLSDQLYRARLLGAPGLALAIEQLESIANHAGALDAEDSAVLRWWVMTARERPLRIYLDLRDETLGIYTAPTHLRSLVRDAEELDLRPSTPPPVDVQMDMSLRTMREVAILDDGADAYTSGEIQSPLSGIFESNVLTTDADQSEVDATLASPPSDALEGDAPVLESAPLPESAEAHSGNANDCDATPDSADCSALIGQAAEPATPTSPDAAIVARPIVSIAQSAEVLPEPAAVQSPLPNDAAPVTESQPLFPEAATRWRDWMRTLDEARGPRPLCAVEQLYVNAYVPLWDAAARGVASPEALQVLASWSSSFARSYGEAFDALRLRNKRPMMVLDIPDAAHRLARLHGARSVQLVLVDSMRFDLGLRIELRMRRLLGQQAAMTERLLLWSALPSNTATQLDLLGRGADGLKHFDPPSESNAFVAHGRAAATLRRVRTGARDVMKLDMVAAALSDPHIESAEGLDSLADEVAPVLSSALLKAAPRTLVVVFGDHGFVVDPDQGGSGGVSHGQSSPEEVMVPAFAWLVGATH